MPAAVAARCAGEQGAYWPYRQALYRQQALLPAAPYAQLARSFRLDVARFEACLGDVQQQALIVADAEKAVAKGIRSTPTFVVGRLVDGQFVGEVIAGAQPIEVFEARLQPLLQQAKQPTRD
jgi:protein-disulfide isomerase